MKEPEYEHAAGMGPSAGGVGQAQEHEPVRAGGKASGNARQRVNIVRGPAERENDQKATEECHGARNDPCDSLAKRILGSSWNHDYTSARHLRPSEESRMTRLYSVSLSTGRKPASRIAFWSV